MKYQPNGTKEDIKMGILHSVGGYYISNEGTASTDRPPERHIHALPVG